MTVKYGISESVGRVREWRYGWEAMVHFDHCPSIRAADYKLPKNVWIIYEEQTIHDIPRREML